MSVTGNRRPERERVEVDRRVEPFDGFVMLLLRRTIFIPGDANLAVEASLVEFWLSFCCSSIYVFSPVSPTLAIVLPAQGLKSSAL
jgi:hypothetical protein